MNATWSLAKGAAATLAILLLAAGCTSGNKMSDGSHMAAARSFKATLSGAQEVPPTASTATGMANATLDPDGTLHWNVSYQSLSGPAAAAHFHGPAAPGANAGVAVNIGDQGLGNPMQGAAHLTAAQVADLAAGRWYINIHTAANPNGEIRGQVVPAQ
jgi:hypothetical protein